MKVYISIILFLSSLLVKAQDQTVSTGDSIQQEISNRYQVYIAPTYTINQFVETGASFAGIGLGFIFKDRIDLSVSYSQILDSFKKQIIFPSRHRFDQSNVGLHGQYSFLNQRFRPHVGFGVQYGMVTWEPEHDSNDTFTDSIYIFNLIVGANWALNKTVTLQANGGYNFTQDVEIVGLESKDFDGFRIDVLLKIRLLNF